MLPVHYELYADARRYDCVDAALAMPIQVFQGRRDDAVDPESWSTGRARGRTSSCTCSTTTIS